MEKKKLSETTKETGGGGLEDGNEEDDLVFPGFRFHPTDQELVGFYLKRKVEKKGFGIDIIREIDIYKHDPWDLPNEARQHVVQGSGEKGGCYYFCLRGRKYRNSIRPNRVTGSGFWKATGIDKPIHDDCECIGLKKSLVYYRGSAGRGTKTDWMMHEFRLPSTLSSAPEFQDAEIWTICRIFKRNMSYNRRCLQQQQKQLQEQGNRTSHLKQQLQLDYYYGYQHHKYTSGAASMTSSFESTMMEATDCHHPFLLHGFHGVPPAVATATTLLGGSLPALPPTESGWSELTSFRGGGSSTWDELWRIMEFSTDST